MISIIFILVILIKISRSFSAFLFKILLFLSSYLPLFLILAIQNYNEYRLLIPLVMLTIITLFTVFLFIHYGKTFEANQLFKIQNIKSQGSEAMNYVSGYIIAFLSLNAPIIVNNKFSFINSSTILILFLVIGNIYISNDLYYINPILSLFYNINEADSLNGDMLIIISSKKIKLKNDEYIPLKQLSNKIYYYK